VARYDSERLAATYAVARRFVDACLRADGSLFTPGKTINIVQCSNRTAGDASACDLKTGKILQPNPTGSGSLEMQVVTGPVGTGVCDADHSECQMRP